MIGTLILLVLCLIVLAVLWILLKNIAKIIINSILGLLLLGIVKVLNIFPLLGFPDIQIGWLSVIVCAIAGIPGAILLLILHIFGLI
ncbi:pro-sigmaK processing inhibitor BofA family protein [Methanospirillum sp. J.3.6.1-F.2.7.3]|jgi:inhibitor of the pro-sigma K processing machinery|uniref:Pro-sigmaK processing inhibitor BofA family protein n=2 Tax=Methanospirillum TaxID=2202 RepID=A0A8E7AUN9_9EURY|nr:MULTISPECIES: pro-sigmaK processing inhibitor BofA family protein [Methanospirillum]MDX8551029.1 pro-sigmaK processing inhibitor BofA family protein [Methanospirillum hungatei]QVV87605.1 pro-sigmaK processing inhibitor BofA family protein [Methanospirillum sp. J.3.6.1-F.2.7.3]QXO95068.1 pro-sigmaK processing inhibitor BofA family protein [Methanospirillum hungatei]